MRVHWIVAAELLLATAGAFAYYYWPQSLVLPTTSVLQAINESNGQTVVSWQDRVFVGKIGEFDDALSAYLMFDYLRSQDLLRGRQVLLIAHSASVERHYSVWVRLPDDVLTGVETAAALKGNHLTPVLEESWITNGELYGYLRQTSAFIEAYNCQDFPKLEEISSSELQLYVRQFISFKASVDPRTWNGSPHPLSPLSLEDAESLAADIVEAARFYDVPVDLLLGIGAMENNFLNAPGDLNNAVWKKEIGRDDIVLRRRGRKAWILNSSMGTWQITRQSLRYAHDLFLCDTRDYSRLPIELRPMEQLDMNFLSPHVLTTYAALLLQDLLQYFDGNVLLAAAAYNGTKLRPNLQYASGVENVASYARRVLGNAARMKRGVTTPPAVPPY